MAKRSYLLKIEKPCTQVWSTMSKNETGRFCTHCSKTVVDLNRLSDSEILQIIKNASGGICGRVTKEQPERKIILPPQSGIRLWYNKLIAGCLLLIFSKKATATIYQPQQEVVKMVNIANDSKNKIQERKCVKDTLRKRIHGKILDAENKEPLTGATITIKDTKLSVLANGKGEFGFSIPDNLLPKKIILVVFYVGYQTTEVVVKRRDIERGKDILIQPQVSILGDVAIIESQEQ